MNSKKLILASKLNVSIGKAETYLNKPLKQSIIAVIITAANAYGKDARPWFDEEMEAYKSLGAEFRIIELEDKSQSKLRALLFDVDVLIVTGGNSFYLLHHAQQSGFLELVVELVDQGVVYMGSSAGALLATPSISTACEYDDASVVELEDHDGLHLVDFLLIPHADTKQGDIKLKKTIQVYKHQEWPIIGLADDQVMVIDGNYIVVL